MKSYLKKVTSLVTAVVMVACLSIPAFASEVSKEDEFMPKSDSTWGDLYRYFDTEGFENLPVEVQQEYNSALLDEKTTSKSTNDVAVMSGDFETVVSSTTYLYKEADSNVAEHQTVNSIDIGGFLNLSLGVSSTQDTISYTAGLFSTINCPRMYCSVTLYDADTGAYVKFNSSPAVDAKVCSVDGTFKYLKSKHEYNLKAHGTVTPPEGYFLGSPLYVETNKKTK
ncbi:hypothetical protein [Oscillibacter ruminantium]